MPLVVVCSHICINKCAYRLHINYLSHHPPHTLHRGAMLDPSIISSMRLVVAFCRVIRILATSTATGKRKGRNIDWVLNRITSLKDEKISNKPNCNYWIGFWERFQLTLNRYHWSIINSLASNRIAENTWLRWIFDLKVRVWVEGNTRPQMMMLSQYNYRNVQQYKQ